jgi:hypothetical protein
MLSRYRLPNQIKDENIVRIIRKDIFVMLQKIILEILLIVLPFIFLAASITLFPNILEGDISYPFVVLFGGIYYLFIWLFFFFSFIDYYLDVWIITNKRIIDVEQRGFFSRVISEQKIENIQDVTSEIHGIIPTIFKFGTVHVQTAAEKSRFILNKCRIRTESGT